VIIAVFGCLSSQSVYSSSDWMMRRTVIMCWSGTSALLEQDHRLACSLGDWGEPSAWFGCCLSKPGCTLGLQRSTWCDGCEVLPCHASCRRVQRWRQALAVVDLQWGSSAPACMYMLF